ncbi:MAG: efflux RND transporter periplasmic adaptor subunit [Dokdonella sp.]
MSTADNDNGAINGVTGTTTDAEPAKGESAPAKIDPAANPEASTVRKNKRRWAFRILIAVVVLAAIGWGAWYWLEGRWYVTTDDAYVDGNVVQITPQTAGTVISIAVDDGSYVEEGQTLVKLDSADADVALVQAKANLANTVRKVRGLYSNVSGAQAQVAAGKVALDRARSDYQRRKNLASSGAISAEELAHARDAMAAAETGLTSSQQQAATSKALVADTDVAEHPDVQVAAAMLRARMLELARTQLRAPVSGYIAKRSVQLGQRVQPGTPLMAVVPLSQLWVDANFKETQLGQMRIAQKVEMTADLYGGDVIYHGTVETLGVGTGSAFSLLPAQNASGNWIKIVQRIPVRIAFDPKELADHPLRVGLSMGVDVGIRDQSGASLNPQVDSGPAKFSTDVYQHNVAEADAEIARIIHANMAGMTAEPVAVAR